MHHISHWKFKRCISTFYSRTCTCREILLLSVFSTLLRLSLHIFHSKHDSNCIHELLITCRRSRCHVKLINDRMSPFTRGDTAVATQGDQCVTLKNSFFKWHSIRTRMLPDFTANLVFTSDIISLIHVTIESSNLQYSNNHIIVTYYQILCGLIQAIKNSRLRCTGSADTYVHHMSFLHWVTHPSVTVGSGKCWEIRITVWIIRRYKSLVKKLNIKFKHVIDL